MTKSVFSKIKTLFGRKKEEGEHEEIEEENKHAFAEHEDPREGEEASQGIEEDKTHVLTESSNENLPKEPQTTLYESEEEPSVEEAPVVWTEGDVIAGLYKVKGSSAGAMGVVYFVDHLGWRIPLAVKTPLPELMAEETVMKRFIREAEVWVDLGLHPNIATCFYVRQIGGLPRIFIEYVEGGSIKDWISEGKVNEWKEILDFAIQFCRGMEYAHAKGVIHRDIKPANCLMTEEGVLKITDFGLVKSRGIAELEGSESEDLQGSGVAVGSLTIAGSGLGTPEYMPPEQFEVAKEAGKEADVYSFGVMLFEMVTGIRPFVMPDDMHPSAREYFYKGAHLNEMPPEPVSLRKDCPKTLNDLILKCLEKDPERRRQNYASFDALCSELEALYQELVKEPYPRRKVEAISLLATSLNNKGVSFYDLGQEEKALSAFSEALSIDASHPEAVYNQVILLWKKGEITDLDVIERIKVVRGNLLGDWRPHYLLGLAHIARKDAEGALSALNEAIKIAPNEPEPKRALYQVLVEKDNWPRCLSILRGHMRGVTAVAFSPDGRFALSGSDDETLRLWDLRLGECIRIIECHTESITSVVFSPDGCFALSVSEKTYQGHTLRLWDLRSGECIRTLCHAKGDVTVAISPDGRLALSSSGYTLRIWDLKTGECLHTLRGHMRGVTAVAFSPDGRFALSKGGLNSGDYTLRLWDIKTGESYHTLKGHTQHVSSMAFSPEGRLALSGSWDGTLRLWDIKTGECLHILKFHPSDVENVAFFPNGRRLTLHPGGVENVAISPDGRLALSGSSDGTLHIWDLKTGECLHTLKGHMGSATVAFSPDGRFALYGSRLDKTLHLWDLGRKIEPFRPMLVLGRIRSMEEEMTLQTEYVTLMEEVEKCIEEKNRLKTVAFLRKAKSIPGYERHPEVLDLWAKVGQRGLKKNLNAAWCLCTLKYIYSVNSVAISPDRRFALSGSGDGTLLLWDVETGDCIRNFEGHKGPINSVAFSPDGRCILSGSNDVTTRLWEIETGECVRTFERRTDCVKPSACCIGGVISVAFSPDGRCILSGSDEGTIRLWDVKTGECLHTLEDDHKYEMNSVALSPDGRFALSGSWDGTLRLWDIKTGECLHILKGHPGDVDSVAFSPDGRFALSGGWKNLRLWDLKTGECLHILKGHTNSVKSVAFSPDGRFALSGSADKTLRLWDLKTRECLHFLEGHTGFLSSVVVSSDGRFALSGSGNDGTLCIWEFDWEYDFPDETEWDEEARPYLEIFLTLRNGKWEEEDFQSLLKELGIRGYGWLKPEGVRKKLEELAAQRKWEKELLMPFSKDEIGELVRWKNRRFVK